VILVALGEEENVKKAIAIVESVKGEPPITPNKQRCSECCFACRFAGMAEEDLPSWLRS